ncbi:tubulin polyglutamylase TTLL11-like isoform X1 [Mytilus trossulus]|uniref:tubulin polyglutamylase TTLL11-like isoform X1 n=1 Tax=Mytilus trossulus TaxID=6551 RepID=UPI003007E6C4
MSMHTKNFNMDSFKKPEPNNFKLTDFRRDLHNRHKREVHMRKERLRAVETRFLAKQMITVDTSRARSNCDVVRMCIKELGMKEFPFGRKEHCDIHWHAVSYEENPDLYGGKVNKFPGMTDICSKMMLFRSLDQMRELFPSDYDFYPRTWYMPTQFHEFSCEVRKLTEKKVKPRPTYIVKPDSGAQGDGIYLIRDPVDYTPSPNGKCHVVQEYLSHVYLIDRYKFDLRVYVVLKSIEPLDIHICKDGLARFSTLPYETPTYKNLHESFMHLTNYSLNKRSTTFNRSERSDEGSKRTISSVLRKINLNGKDGDQVWKTIERIVCKTVIAMLPTMRIEYQANIPPGKTKLSCFQILGFDIILMDDLKPMLLEVNSGPSLSIECEQEVAPGIVEYVASPTDEEIKRPLVRDTIMLVVPKEKLKYCRRRKRRLKRLQQEQRESCRSGKRPRFKSEPLQRQRTHILIINADEPDASKREIDVTKQMSEMHLDHYNDSRDQESATSRDAAKDLSEVDMPKMELDSEMSESHDDDTNHEEDSHEDDHDHDSPTSRKESCLKHIYPAIYDDEFERLRLLERVAELFRFCLGVRGSLRIGPTGFRTFARKCRLNRRGMTNASIDIMYIDMQRKFDHMNPERTSDNKPKKTVGLCFQGFLSSCLEIARRKFYAPTKLEMLENLLDYCEVNICQRDDDMPPTLPRLQYRPKQSSSSYGQSSTFRRKMSRDIREETIEDLLDKTQKNSEIEAFLRQGRRMNYVPKPVDQPAFMSYHSE